MSFVHALTYMGYYVSSTFSSEVRRRDKFSVRDESVTRYSVRIVHVMMSISMESYNPPTVACEAAAFSSGMNLRL